MKQEEVYSVAEKLPPLNVEVIGYDENWNEYTCAYDGEIWYVDMILCDPPIFWKFKNMEE